MHVLWCTSVPQSYTQGTEAEDLEGESGIGIAENHRRTLKDTRFKFCSAVWLLFGQWLIMSRSLAKLLT